MRITFRGQIFKLIITDHARDRAGARKVSETLIKEVVRTGEVKPKPALSNKFWAFKYIEGREDNLIAVSLAVEGDDLIVITILIGWRPT